MVTEHDERRGLIKTNWANIRKRVQAVEPTFTKLVDELSPGKNFPIYLAYIPYGGMKGDTESSYMPKEGGGFYKLNDPDAPKDVIKNLGYGIGSSPLGLILEKSFEYFIDMPQLNLTIPWAVAKPGEIFPYSGVLDAQYGRKHMPNGVLSTSAGVRSTFFLASIGCNTNYMRLKRDYNLSGSVPKTLYEQWRVFGEIADSAVAECEWMGCLLYFSESWLEKLLNDSAWMKLKLYILEKGLRLHQYSMCSQYYDFIFSTIQHNDDRSNQHLVDTARYIMKALVAGVPCYAPTMDENALPVKTLQRAIIESYDLQLYKPTLIAPTLFELENQKLPAYYSLQYPCAHPFFPRTKGSTTISSDLNVLEGILLHLQEKVQSDNSYCADTILTEAARRVKINFYHNSTRSKNQFIHSSEILKTDPRFNMSYDNQDNREFCAESKFLSGCVSFSVN